MFIEVQEYQTKEESIIMCNSTEIYISSTRKYRCRRRDQKVGKISFCLEKCSNWLIKVFKRNDHFIVR